MNTRAGWIVIGTLGLIVGLLTLGILQQPHPPRPVAAWTPPSTTTSAIKNQRKVSQAELVANNGLNGRECYIAVRGEVYVIPPSTSWQNGQHIPSNGLAYCGRDLTAALAQSPHGDSVLSSLVRVGLLER